MDQVDAGQRRTPFGLTSACGLIVANMIGAGVFTTSGFSLVDLSREYVLLAWLIAGLIALCGAYSYGLLARSISESGGEYLFLSRRIHPGIGFLAGWVSLLQGFTGAIAFAAVTFEAYALPESFLPTWYRSGMLAIAAIVVFAGLHAAVLRKGVVTQNIVVGLKLALLGGFVGYAMFAFGQGRWPGWGAEGSSRFSWLALATSLVYISLSYSGFNAAVYISEEVSDPRRNVPRAMLISTVAVMVIYLALNFVFVYAPEPAAITGQKEIAALAAHAVGGPSADLLVRTAICLALLSSVSSMVIAGPRVYAKMAEDGVFPAWFRIGEQGGERVPARAIAFQAVLASLVVLFTTLRQLLEVLAFTLSVCAAFTVMCVFLPGNKHESAPAGEVRAGGIHRLLARILPAIYVVATLTFAALLVSRDFQASETWWYSPSLLGFLATIVSGGLLYGTLRSARKI